MTFEEWCEDHQAIYRTIENKKDLYCLVKDTWNAAIEAVEQQTWSFYWKNEKAGGDLDFVLEKLKAKSS